MDDNTIEVRDDGINVEEIMATIRENIRRRQAAGELPPDPDSIIKSASKSHTTDTSNESVQQNLAYINSNWDIHNNSYVIRSQRPFIGEMLVKGRRLVHGEVRRYVDPMVYRQTEFNASTVRILNQTSQRYEDLYLKISRQREEIDRNSLGREEEFNRKFYQQGEELSRKFSLQEQEFTRMFTRQDEELSRKFSLQEREFTRMFSLQEEKLNTSIQNRVDSNFRKVFSRIDKDLRLQLGLAHLLEERIQNGLVQNSIVSESIFSEGPNYFLFEEQFRGARNDIKERQRAFLPYFQNCSRVLDIGCGRGEFLEILRDNNIGSIGVDLDADMVSYCKSHQLDVVRSDALSFMESLENKSLDGIFIDQVIEHLEPMYLVRLLTLCYQKLKFGYYLVVETVNPLSFVSFVNFYIDMTHKKPVHPETLQYLFSASGFRECEKKFLSPVSDESRLKKIGAAADMNETERKNVDVYNHNIELLNIVLFGAQDYAVVGKK
jgi:O-antigen chain-terminating methyltransferase